MHALVPIEHVAKIWPSWFSCNWLVDSNREGIICLRAGSAHTSTFLIHILHLWDIKFEVNTEMYIPCTCACEIRWSHGVLISGILCLTQPSNKILCIHLSPLRNIKIVSWWRFLIIAFGLLFDVIDVEIVHVIDLKLLWSAASTHIVNEVYIVQRYP